MRSPFRTTLAALVLIVVFGDIYASASSQLQEGSLYGTVTAEGTPISGVKVSALHKESGKQVSATVTNEQGQFRLPHLPPGQYRIEATLEGFATASEDVTLTVGRNTTLEIELVPASRPITGKIRGTIKNRAGQPVGGAEVTFKGPNDQEKSTQTETDGSYKQAGLKPGDWMMRVEATGYRPAQRSVKLQEREDKEENFVLKEK